MKKLITFTFALLFTAGMAFGQSNEAESQQNGDNNEVTVQQKYISDGSYTGANHVTTNQDGNKNTIKRLSQAGAENIFNVTQKGDRNYVTHHPNQGEAQGGPASWGGSIKIRQIGTYNHVWDADQAGYNNKMTINQKGDDNTANVEAQVNMDHQYNRNVITIRQYGDQNAVGGYGETESGAYQEGGGNKMDITQRNGATAGQGSYDPTGDSGAKSFTERQFRSNEEGGQGLIQLGIDNWMNVDQDGANFAPVLYQNGEDNALNVTQTGSGNKAESYQMGNKNISNIAQIFGADDNNAVFIQDGNNNSGTITQGAIFGSSTGNSADWTQTGDNNSGAIIQGAAFGSSSDNTVQWTQTGNNNGGLVIQGNGHDNMATITQNSDMNFANVSQIGVGNTATVIQN